MFLAAVVEELSWANVFLRSFSAVSRKLWQRWWAQTRGRVNFFMNKFRKLGFIRYDGEIEVHSSLLNVVLND
jgi:hypothetical protein